MLSLDLASSLRRTLLRRDIRRLWESRLKVEVDVTEEWEMFEVFWVKKVSEV